MSKIQQLPGNCFMLSPRALCAGENDFEVVSWAEGVLGVETELAATFGDASTSRFFGGRPLFFGGGACRENIILQLLLERFYGRL